jgi:hypothetical protein
MKLKNNLHKRSGLMSSKGNYMVRGTQYKGEDWWIVVNTSKDKNFHTHVKNRKTAEMIAIRAHQGTIPSHYPSWMIDSINRLWFGKNYLDRDDLNNNNLMTNNPKVRFIKKKRKRVHGCKGYYNKPKQMFNDCTGDTCQVR